MRKLIVLALLAIVTVTSFAADARLASRALAKYDPPITVPAGIVMDVSDVLLPKDKTPENHAWIDYCRDILGINLKVEWYVPESQWVEKVNLVIASGSMPEM